MPCYHPLVAWRSKLGRSSNGNWPLVFNRRSGFVDKEVLLPCGQCSGCRLEHSRQWAIRCVLEARSYSHNCFITLTYSEAQMPSNGSLSKEAFQKFMKRLRRHFNCKIRYYACGEYGEALQRPHYHACLFGFDFADKRLWSVRNSVPLFRARSLESIWPFGYSTIGEVTFESAAYVARYCMKKQTGAFSCNYGERIPEFALMSRRPGVGRSFMEKFYSDAVSVDGVVLRNGLRLKLPRYYNDIVKGIDRARYDSLAYRRRRKVNLEESTYDRLMVREEVERSRTQCLRRSLHAVQDVYGS